MNKPWLGYAFLACTSFAQAQLVVIDPDNLVENTIQEVQGGAQLLQEIKQSAQLVQNYTQMLKDYQQMLKDYKAIVGGRGMAFVRNGTFDRDFIRRYMPADFNLAMNMRYSSSTSGGTNRYQQSLQNLANRYLQPEVWPAFQYTTHTNSTMRNIYDDRLRASQASMAAGQTAQYNIDQRMSSIEDILRTSETSSDDESNDLKRSVDLNTRMVAETAFIQAELIRLMSQQINLVGLQDQEDLSRQARRQQLLQYRGY